VVVAGRISIVPTPYPKEFRRDVVAVARQGDQSIAQVARSFGVSGSCLNRWLKIADRDEGVTVSASPTSDDAEKRELRRRNRQFEQENEILRRATAYFARDTLPK
jgi:transposase-like protein